MPWVKFTADFNFHTRRNTVTTSFKAGMERLVTSRCAEQAIAAGKAEAIERPLNRSESDGPEH